MIYVYSHGRMGNQYFQYAFARNLQLEIEKKYGIKHDIVIDFGTEGDMLSHTNAIYEKANINKKRGILRFNNIIAYKFFKNDNKNYKYGKLINKLFNIIGIFYNRVGYYNLKIYNKKNYIVDGYFQSERYFINNKDIIKPELKNKKNINGDLNKIIKSIDNNSICVHIRRGDYTSSIYKNKFLVCDKNYYLKAINFFKKKYNKYKFYIFSDDIDWVKRNFKLPENTFYDIKRFPDYYNFSIMYSCKNFILSNSSFSWWAQYLSDSNIILAPSVWNNEIDNRDIYQKKWTIIDVNKNG